MKVLMLDAYNMIHRCRFRFGGGKEDLEGWTMVYNFFNVIKATIEEYSADKVYFVLDGKPKARKEIYPEYKANRKINEQDPEEVLYWENFHRQKRKIISLAKENLPITVVYHPDEEADDVIYHLCKTKCSSNDDIVIISSDSDYIQIINEMENVRLYNPVSKKYRSKTEYDYVSWKAMVGDRADNIPGVPRIGKVTAEKILKNGSLSERLLDQKFKDNYTIGYNLIKMRNLEAQEETIQYWQGELVRDVLEKEFSDMLFNSLLKNGYIDKFAMLIK